MAELLDTIVNLFIIVFSTIGFVVTFTVAWVYFLLYQQSKDRDD
jgi:hypothetical protein